MTSINYQVASNIAMESLKAAMDTVGITGQPKIDMIGYFANEWNDRTRLMSKAVPEFERKSVVEVEKERLANDPYVQAAKRAAIASKGAAGTFLRRDQCSHGKAEGEELALYNQFLAILHQVGDILMKKPRGTYAIIDNQMYWVSPLGRCEGADLFGYTCGGFDVEEDGNGTWPAAYFDELGVGSEVQVTMDIMISWLEDPEFGQMEPDYLLDQVALMSDVCKYKGE